MSNRNFRRMIEDRWGRGKFVCVGLDSDYDKIPLTMRQTSWGGDLVAETILAFNRAIVNATHDVVCAYKPNSAFYEKHGVEGVIALKNTIAYIHSYCPDVPVILDAKRADIGGTSAAYAQAAFDAMGSDAVTVSPYLGSDALKPFLDYRDKGIFVLCRTSNRGSGEIQSLSVGGGGVHNVFREVAIRVTSSWNANANCGVVVGATCPGELAEVRKIVGDMPILIPGIGVQGGDIKSTVESGRDSRNGGMIVNSSRGIIFASSGSDFADAARTETLRLHNLINLYR